MDDCAFTSPKGEMTLVGRGERAREVGVKRRLGNAKRLDQKIIWTAGPEEVDCRRIDDASARADHDEARNDRSKGFSR